MSGRARTAVIFSIERHALHDGPGIRTLVFFKGCGLRCLWCSNPEGQAFSPELLYRAKDCVGCGRCARACPQGAVSPVRVSPQAGCGEGGASRPGAGSGPVATDRSRCTACGACVSACPAGARALAGRTMTVREVLETVLKDEVFYRSSGGGLTASGGEPLSQPLFLRELFETAGVQGIHRAVETCGHVPWESFETVLPFTDLFLYDVKHMDGGSHRRCTGSGNALILENLERLDRLGAHLIVRVPVVPSFNDRPEDVRAIARFAMSLGTKPAVQLIPYHPLGRSKYRHLEREYPLEGLAPSAPEKLETLLCAALEVNPNATLEK